MKKKKKSVNLSVSYIDKDEVSVDCHGTLFVNVRDSRGVPTVGDIFYM